MDRICLLDLNYTLVCNQEGTKRLRPFTRRLEAEEFRTDLIEAVRGDHVILITVRPDRQREETLTNILRKTGWQPQEWYFNDIDAWSPEFKRAPSSGLYSRGMGRMGASITPWRATPGRGSCMPSLGLRPRPMRFSSGGRGRTGAPGDRQKGRRQG